MIVYNITIKVDNDIVDEWLQWQKEFYIQEILDTGLFYDHRVFKLLGQDESDGKTFVIQFFANHRKDYDRYIQYHEPAVVNKALQKWRNKFMI